MKYVEAPNSYDEYGTDTTLFLAGGITGCPDWQQEMVGLLEDLPITLLNPRREDFPIGDPDAAMAQIQWEHNALRDAGAVMFWFPKETLCPIVLYELGAWSMTAKPIFVGTEPGYARTQDVEIQTGLVRPTVPIVHALNDLSAMIHKWWDARIKLPQDKQQ